MPSAAPAGFPRKVFANLHQGEETEIMAGAASLPTKTSAPDPVRKDPRRRRADGAGDRTKLKNADPEKHYVLAAPMGELGAAYYEQLGYEPVKQVPGGVRLGMVTAKDGETITYRDHILMSIAKEERENIEQYGADGESGQDYADRIERHMIHERAGDDLMRGIQASKRHFSFKNETTTESPGL